ncbi:MAG: hypothetical protein JO058_23040 [Alphaproteobacteria bacterium]|nr:hypothetical protein [Alphaproteobacteria bacterium]
MIDERAEPKPVLRGGVGADGIPISSIAGFATQVKPRVHGALPDAALL